MDMAWLWIFLLLQVSWTFPLHLRRNNGQSLLKNTVESPGDHNNFIKKSRTEQNFNERLDNFLEMIGGRRTNRQDLLKYHRSQCSFLSQQWAWHQDIVYQPDPSAIFMLRVFTGPLRPMFPEQNLFRYISRVYKCCKLGFTCKRIKGLQGTLAFGDGKKEVEFYFDPDIFSLSILRAELHLQVSLSDQLVVIPVLMAKGRTYSSFTQLKREHFTDLALDVMFLLKMMKEMNTEDMMREDVTELSLALHCIQNDFHVPCNLYGVSMLHSPFLVLQYE
ncbi:hypothetical protein GDO86_001800 [Hymenochirus boettgeri]|uniref:Uncharacterized protein n=1 Tax=Hymenochirus boettgeri TaxID=247094 RepID=A0A8T2KH28_9PIPI|nr:hypothetical protein GDO86_001800 [Hymenochirus boettgeri]